MGHPSGTKEEVFSLAEKFLETFEHSSAAVVTAAWAILNAERPEALDFVPGAVEWVRSAQKTLPGDWKLSHALASLLARVGNWKAAIDALEDAVTASAKSEEALKYSTDFLISAVAKGNARDVLSLLERHSGNGALDPLRIGIRIFKGEQPVVAQEVSEVAEDVAKKIRELQAEIDNSGALEIRTQTNSRIQ